MKIRASCKKCPLYTRLRYFVPSTVDKEVTDREVDLVFVGEAPGENEVIEQEGFVGAAGKMLNQMLDHVGIKRKDVRFTNVLKCWPKGNHLPDDIDTAIECCSSYLEEDIKGAKVIVGLGGLALKAFTGYSGVLNRRGSVYELDDGRPFISTLHPSYLRRIQYAKQKERSIVPQVVVESDIAKALRILKGEDWLGWKSIPLITYPSQNEIETFLNRLYSGEEKYVVFDIETTHVKKNPIKVPILCGFMIKDKAICLDFEQDLAAIYWALKSPTPKICHGGVFDVFVLEDIGFKVVNYNWDTLYMHHDMFAELPHALKFVQSVYTWQPFHKDLISWEEENE